MNTPCSKSAGDSEPNLSRKAVLVTEVTEIWLQMLPTTLCYATSTCRKRNWHDSVQPLIRLRKLSKSFPNQLKTDWFPVFSSMSFSKTAAAQKDTGGARADSWHTWTALKIWWTDAEIKELPWLRFCLLLLESKPTIIDYIMHRNVEFLRDLILDPREKAGQILRYPGSS